MPSMVRCDNEFDKFVTEIQGCDVLPIMTVLS
jgi:hypothetical protein